MTTDLSRPEERAAVKSILAKIDESGLVPRAIDILRERLESDEIETADVAGILKTVVNALVALEGLDIKSKRGTKVENHLHITGIFKKSEQELEAMTPEARQLYEGLRLMAAEKSS